MSGTVRLASGGTVTVSTGVIKGVGPIGPQGLQGPPGPVGPPGPAGPAGEVYDAYAAYSDTSQISTSSTRWTALTWGTQTENEGNMLALSPDREGFSVDTTGLYVVSAYVSFTEQTTYDGLRSVGLFTSRYVDTTVAGAEAAAMVSAADYQSSNGDQTTQAVLTVPVKLTAGKYYYVLATSTSAANAEIPVTTRKLVVSRIGVGRKGDQGAVGPQGPVGPEGPRGATGSGNPGAAIMNDLAVGSPNTTLIPASTTFDQNFDKVTSQQIPVPKGSAKAHISYHFREFANAIVHRMVKKYENKAAYDASTDKRPGDIVFDETTGGLWAYDHKGVGYPLARVIVTNRNPDTGQEFPPGTLWLKYTDGTTSA